MIELPPFHPLAVHFPVALLPASVASDVLGRFTGRPSLAHAGWWTLLFATIASPVAAASGWIWLSDMDGMTGTTITIHQWLGTVMPILLIALTAWRYRAHVRETPVSTAYLAAATVVLMAMVVQGHLGATMTFGGSSHDHEPATVPADDGWRDSIQLKEHHHE